MRNERRSSGVRAFYAIAAALGSIVWLLVFMRRGIGSVFYLVGLVSFGLAAVTHLCKALQLFPGMGWGLPHTPGHYLNLDSSLAGVILLTSGIILTLRERRRLR